MEKPSAPPKKRMPMVKVLSIADALCHIFETSFGDKAHIYRCLLIIYYAVLAEIYNDGTLNVLNHGEKRATFATH